MPESTDKPPQGSTATTPDMDPNKSSTGWTRQDLSTKTPAQRAQYFNKLKDFSAGRQAENRFGVATQARRKLAEYQKNKSTSMTARHRMRSLQGQTGVDAFYGGLTVPTRLAYNGYTANKNYTTDADYQALLQNAREEQKYQREQFQKTLKSGKLFTREGLNRWRAANPDKNYAAQRRNAGTYSAQANNYWLNKKRQLQKMPSASYALEALPQVIKRDDQSIQSFVDRYNEQVAPIQQRNAARQAKYKQDKQQAIKQWYNSQGLDAPTFNQTDQAGNTTEGSFNKAFTHGMTRQRNAVQRETNRNDYRINQITNFIDDPRVQLYGEYTNSLDPLGFSNLLRGVAGGLGSMYQGGSFGQGYHHGYEQGQDVFRSNPNVPTWARGAASLAGGFTGMALGTMGATRAIGSLGAKLPGVVGNLYRGGATAGKAMTLPGLVGRTALRTGSGLAADAGVHIVSNWAKNKYLQPMVDKLRQNGHDAWADAISGVADVTQNVGATVAGVGVGGARAGGVNRTYRTLAPKSMAGKITDWALGGTAGQKLPNYMRRMMQQTAQNVVNLNPVFNQKLLGQRKTYDVKDIGQIKQGLKTELQKKLKDLQSAGLSQADYDKSVNNLFQEYQKRFNQLSDINADNAQKAAQQDITRAVRERHPLKAGLAPFAPMLNPAQTGSIALGLMPGLAPNLVGMATSSLWGAGAAGRQQGKLVSLMRSPQFQEMPEAQRMKIFNRYQQLSSAPIIQQLNRSVVQQTLDADSQARANNPNAQGMSLNQKLVNAMVPRTVQALNNIVLQYGDRSTAKGAQPMQSMGDSMQLLNSTFARMSPQQQTKMLDNMLDRDDVFKTAEALIRMQAQNPGTATDGAFQNAFKKRIQEKAWDTLKQNPWQNGGKAISLYLNTKGIDNGYTQLLSGPGGSMVSLASVLLPAAFLFSGGSAQDEQKPQQYAYTRQPQRSIGDIIYGI